MISRSLVPLVHGLLWCALKLALWLVRILPRSLLLSLSEFLADASFYLLYTLRRRSIENFSIALGKGLGQREIALLVRKSFRNFFRAFVELGLALEAPEDFHQEVPLVGREHLEAALAKGKGVIALSAHLGNFFLLGSRLGVEGYPIYVLVKQSPNGTVPRLMDRCRLKLKQRTIHARPRRQASQKLVQVLRRNELAVVIADEYGSASGIPVPFFGRTVLGRRGPATLALRTGAAVLPMYLVRDLNGRLRLIIEPEIELLRSGQTKTAIGENILRITQWLEGVVRRYPDQWNWTNVHWQQTSADSFVEKGRRHEKGSTLARLDRNQAEERSHQKPTQHEGTT
jgi:Kdo2-lipid IVA lauroyltransferase/acyltransferase